MNAVASPVLRGYSSFKRIVVHCIFMSLLVCVCVSCMYTVGMHLFARVRVCGPEVSLRGCFPRAVYLELPGRCSLSLGPGA